MRLTCDTVIASLHEHGLNMRYLSEVCGAQVTTCSYCLPTGSKSVLRRTGALFFSAVRACKQSLQVDPEAMHEGGGHSARGETFASRFHRAVMHFAGSRSSSAFAVWHVLSCVFGSSSDNMWRDVLPACIQDKFRWAGHSFTSHELCALQDFSLRNIFVFRRENHGGRSVVQLEALW